MPGGGADVVRRLSTVLLNAAGGLAGGVVCVVSAAAAPATLSPLVDAAGQIGAPWRVVGLPAQKPPVTAYSAVRLGERAALRIEAQGSYGNLVHALPAGSVLQGLRWAWRLEQPNPAANLRTKAGDDNPVKVCLSFELPLAQVPFVERQLLRLARAKTGEPLPAATLCYVWDAREPVGTLLPNAYTGRVRLIVLRNGGDVPGTWVEERRDVAADFRRAFGAESAEIPPLSAVIVSGDADNTGASTLAFVADLRAEP
jgi:Protein of unknown function (DUF3047)